MAVVWLNCDCCGAVSAPATTVAVAAVAAASLQRYFPAHLCKDAGDGGEGERWTD